MSAKTRHVFALVLERDLGFQELIAQLSILVAFAFEFHIHLALLSRLRKD
jgi:hypothetical protein